MAIYIFDQTMKRMSDNVADMKWYKEQILGKTDALVRYVFTKMPEYEDVRKYGEVVDDIKQLVGMYQYFTDNHTLEHSVKIEDKLEELKKRLRYTNVNRTDTEIQLSKGGYIIASITLDKEYCREIYYFSYTKLLRQEIYTDGVACTNYYITARSENGLYAKLTRRTFYNGDGSVAYDQILEGEKEWFVFPDGNIFTKEQLVIEFIKKLNLSRQDVVFLDDSLSDEVVRAIFTFGKEARIIVLAHIGQRKRKSGNDEEIFREGYYYDWFPYSEMLDTMVVPTEEQKWILLNELEKYHCKFPDIVVIPINGTFTMTVLYESNEENLVLSWNYRGKVDGFWIYDEFGVRICEINNLNQHYYLIKGYRKENGFVIKAFVESLKGKMVVGESERIYVSAKQIVNVMDMQETLEYVKTRRISIARFGDGEIKLMTGRSIAYQDYDEGLAKRLKQIITLPDNDKLLVCLPDVFEKLERYNATSISYWKWHLEQYQDFYAEVIIGEKCYGSAFISRPYMDLADKSISGKHFQNMKELFADKDILIVEGFYSRSGVGNDLFQRAKSIERIICPSRNAYRKYELILNTIRQHGTDKLILLMLGPTAKVLAYDLAFEGFWAIDIGHVDSEYEWYKMGATHKVKFQNKHTAEVNYDEDIEVQKDDTYVKEIVAVLSEQY